MRSENFSAKLRIKEETTPEIKAHNIVTRNLYLYPIVLVIVLNYSSQARTPTTWDVTRLPSNPRQPYMAPTTRGLQEEEYDIVRSWKKNRDRANLRSTQKGASKQQNNKKEKTSGIKASGRPAEDKTVKKTSGIKASGRPAEDETVKKTSGNEASGRPPRTGIAERIQLVDNFAHHDDVKPRRGDVKR